VLVLADAEAVAFITGGATVIAALFLGGLAAWAAERRLTKQVADAGTRQERELADAGARQQRELEADAARQQRELDAQAEAQKRQLDHARELHDLADLRKLLDEGAVALNSAEDALLDAAAAIRKDIVDEDAREVVKEASEALVTLRARLYVRLGPGHEITNQVDRATVALLRARNILLQASIEPEVGPDATKERSEAIDAADRSFANASTGFVAAAVESAGTAIPAP
jgi:hypothetical protein